MNLLGNDEWLKTFSDGFSYSNVYDLHQAITRDGVANDEEWRVLA